MRSRTARAARLIPGSRRLLLIAGAAAAIAGVGAYCAGALGQIENGTLSARFALRGVSRPDDVVVVAIDEHTFSALRLPWPFPRSLHARVIDRLHAAGARAIVYDVQFTEPTSLDQDTALYRAVGRARGIVLATTIVDSHGHTNVLGGDANIAAAHAVVGAANLPSSADGVIRGYPYRELGLPSLAVAGALAAGARITASAFDHGIAWIDYRGGTGTITTVSFADVLTGRVNRSVFAGKVVVVGASSPTLQDVHPTPTTAPDDPMPGAEVQANAIWTALHGNPLRSAPLWLTILAIIVGAVAAPLAALRLSVLRAAAVAVAMIGAYLLIGQAAFDSGTRLVLSYPILACGVGVIGTVLASYSTATSERRALAIRLRESQTELLTRLSAAAESRDNETGRHIRRIGILCERLAFATGWSVADAEMLRHASAMHDVGKIGTPDTILLKPGGLSQEEWRIMKTHTTRGARILAGSANPLVRMAESIARSHHERWDGGGYPDGLSGEGIPLAARICAACDVLDALLSSRTYKQAWSLADALAEIERLAGSHLDPRLAHALLENAADITSGLATAYEPSIEPSTARAVAAPASVVP